MLIIRGGITPQSDGSPSDVIIEAGKILEVTKRASNIEGADVIDASGMIVAPGLADMHVHFREPGFEYKEDISTGSQAAAAGGVTTVACMPNTRPVIDSAEAVRRFYESAEKTGINVLTYGAVTRGQLGESLTDFEALKATGVVALSDDGNPVMSAYTAHKAMQRAKAAGLFISSHCEDAEMVKNYAVNEGEVSKKLGIPGRPAIAEEIMAARDIMLARETGAHVHIAHVSTAGTVELIRRGKNEGVNVTAETCPQYFTLTESEILTQGALARVNPPLRTPSDVQAIIEGLVDGTIDVIATDHAPHSNEEKSRGLTESPSGMIGLETLLGLVLTKLWKSGVLNLRDIFRLISETPAKLLGQNSGVLKPGCTADLVIFNPNECWSVDPAAFKSKARNTPFEGAELTGRVKYTISRGHIVYTR